MIIPNKFSLSEFINVNSNQILTTNSNAKNAIELILQKVLKCNRIDLYTKTDLTPNKKQFQIISTYMNRLKKGEPIQYILNQAFFYGHSFFVDSNVLIPRFDTELIIEILKEHKKCIDLLEIGTGSGNIAITIFKENLAENILATDTCEEKVNIAKYNEQKVCPNSNISFIIDDFLNTKIINKFDIIVSNPPYIPISQINQLDPLVKYHEPLSALSDGEDGYHFYRKFASYGRSILKEDGFMLLEIGVDNKLEKLYNIFSNYRIKVYKDINNISRVIKVY